MPFMKGAAPVRRTLKYLNAGRIVLKDKIKIFSVNYNTFGDHHKGARDFVFWCLPQVQYKNPDVQVLTFRNMTPSPFIRVFLDDGKDLVVDIDGKENEEILDHLCSTLCKTASVLQAEAIAKQVKVNPANFGYGCKQSCICRIPGQVPCSGLVTLPKHMRGKYVFFDRDDGVPS
ncbi:probable 28S ribosomal protein S25, mitochondrial [Thrips palmi]|uniref:Small ribosomal subunit protein mS25 n=1 Tax=Thrips palmi TaxID=161013 RepID=A0A6P8XUM9_THRPL|nr:probable 28S ribosomal protein S25, mitochondrial [Thrips palmi]